MGLDMYLSQKHYVKNWDHMKDEERHHINITKGLRGKVDIDVDKISYITTEAGYWRKANQVHQWFVDNCQDGNDNCQESYVSAEQLIELRQVCKDVLADHSKAEDLLPIQQGFFFGGAEYDEYYFEDLKETVTILDAALVKNSEGYYGDFYYQASW
jgi:hypothetical protein